MFDQILGIISKKEKSLEDRKIHTSHTIQFSGFQLDEATIWYT